MIALVFISSGAALITVTIAAFFARRISRTSYIGLIAIANSLLGVGNALNHETVWLCVNAAGAALSAWLWWHGGGGDGTRRRLKKWARRFHGVRRTAPSAV